MLVNKNKSKEKQNTKSDSINNNIQSMRSWVRKIEQSTSSISSRLSAVEKRISTRMNGDSKNSVSGLTIIDGPIDNIISKIKDQTEDTSIEYIFRVLDNELAMIQDDIEEQSVEIEKFKEHIDKIGSSIDETNDELVNIRDSTGKNLINFNNRIEKLERKAPPTMKIGRLEIPIEISGIIAGFIAIIAALMVSFEMTDILITPLFLGFVGLLFISTTIAKTLRSRNPAN